MSEKNSIEVGELVIIVVPDDLQWVINDKFMNDVDEASYIDAFDLEGCVCIVIEVVHTSYLSYDFNGAGEYIDVPYDDFYLLTSKGTMQWITDTFVVPLCQQK